MTPPLQADLAGYVTLTVVGPVNADAIRAHKLSGTVPTFRLTAPLLASPTATPVAVPAHADTHAATTVVTI
jgi:hypothetical protein